MPYARGSALIEKEGSSVRRKESKTRRYLKQLVDAKEANALSTQATASAMYSLFATDRAPGARVTQTGGGLLEAVGCLAGSLPGTAAGRRPERSCLAAAAAPRASVGPPVARRDRAARGDRRASGRRAPAALGRERSAGCPPVERRSSRRRQL